MGELRQLQTEHAEWQARNFPEQTLPEAFMGMAEELGEMAHALLKYEQGIRGLTKEEMLAAVTDAHADLIIFSVFLANYFEYDLEEVLLSTWSQVSQRDWIANPENAHELTDNEASAEQATWD